MMLRALALALTLGLVACDNTAKDGELRVLVARYLDYYGETFGAGLASAGEDQIFMLTEGQAHTIDLDLEAGREYRFIGACDNECVDIDLQLLDIDSGEVVAFDNLTDNYPVVAYAAPEAGRYRLALQMYACTIQPCYAGVRIVTAAAEAAAGPSPEATPAETAAAAPQ